MEAKSASVSIPGVEGCLAVRVSVEGVLTALSALMRYPRIGLKFSGEVAACWACTTALGGKVGGGRVVFASGDGWVTCEALGLLGFFEGVLPGGTGVGPEFSCGESIEEISIAMTDCSSNVDPSLSMRSRGKRSMGVKMDSSAGRTGRHALA